MKGKHLNSGIRGGLWDRKHELEMGRALWLFGWLVHRQTTQKLDRGLVLRGKPLTYALIAEDTGWKRRTIQRWMAHLAAKNYIEVKHTTYKRLIVSILKAKKFQSKQMPLFTEFPQSYAPDVAHIGTKSGAFKEGAEIEHKPLRQTPKPRPQNRRADSLTRELQQRWNVAARTSRLDRERDAKAVASAGAFNYGIVRIRPEALARIRARELARLERPKVPAPPIAKTNEKVSERTVRLGPTDRLRAPFLTLDLIESKTMPGIWSVTNSEINNRRRFQLGEFRKWQRQNPLKSRSP